MSFNKPVRNDLSFEFKYLASVTKERRISMKKILNYLISILMCFSGLSTPIHAVTNDYPNSNYAKLTNDQKEILDHMKELDPTFDISGEYVQVEKKIGHISEKTSQTYGAISPSNMAIYISVSRINDPGKDTFKVSAVAEWLNVPTIRVQDGFGIAWAGNFAITSHNAVTCYKGVGVLSGKTSLMQSQPNTGLGYAVECSHYYGQALDWVRIDATISQLDSSGIANICATYSHATANLGISGVSISKTPSISFSFYGTSDSMSKITSVSY